MDVGTTVWMSMMGAIPHLHRLEQRNLLPADMAITEADRAPTANIQTHLERIGRKLGPIFNHPRRLLAHFFWLEDGKRWWLLVFNYLEIGTRDPGWAQGVFHFWGFAPQC